MTFSCSTGLQSFNYTSCGFQKFLVMPKHYVFIGIRFFSIAKKKKKTNKRNQRQHWVRQNNNIYFPNTQETQNRLKKHYSDDLKVL